MSEQSIDERIAQLSKFRLYHGLSTEQLALLVDLHTPKHFNSGESLILQDELTTGIFFILKGRCIISLFNAVTKKKVEIGAASDECCAGHYILSKKIPRTANVVAMTETEVLVADANDLLLAFDKNIDLGIICYRNLSGMMLSDIIGTHLFIEKMHLAYKEGSK